MYNTNSFIPNWELAVLSEREILIPYPCLDNNLQICCLTEYTHSLTQVDTSVSAGHWSSGNKIFMILRSSICFCLWAATSAWEFTLLCLDTEGILYMPIHAILPTCLTHRHKLRSAPDPDVLLLLAQFELPAEGRALPWQRAEKAWWNRQRRGLMLPFHICWVPALATTHPIQCDRPITHLQTGLLLTLIKSRVSSFILQTEKCVFHNYWSKRTSFQIHTAVNYCIWLLVCGEKLWLHENSWWHRWIL